MQQTTRSSDLKQKGRQHLASGPVRYFKSSPEIIRLVVIMYVRSPMSLRHVEDLLAERGIDICHETVRHWWNRFGPMFAAEVRRQRVSLRAVRCASLRGRASHQGAVQTRRRLSS